MSDRACIRGCTVKDVHFAECDDFGKTGDVTCRGCVPREARDGALICERCYRRLRSLLEDSGDLVGHLRSLADPTKAGAIDRSNPSARPELPAPVAADLVDASDHIVRNLRQWALHLQGYGEYVAAGLEAGASAAEAFEDASACAEVILLALDDFVNDSHQIEPLCEAVLDRAPAGAEPDMWTLADVAARWRLADTRASWAPAPCPDCDRMTVRIHPARGRVPERYVCQMGQTVPTEDCGWEANALDDGGLWSELYATEPADVRAHDPRWMTLADAARLAGFTQGTVRRWAEKELVKTDAGRYWREDVEAVAAERKGKAA
ncbi:helix-turn-helix domain-containing protein [Microbacterium stercoris]|uniref:Helix-turn-helix domain-containing protein n=1 Tax=Microbacterium stercoris TaxID=2820289 RepID=A0A939TN03_9MICO|nr:helix-turn-helix domain-containing protein [Microbacterium stercoris]MBO3663718.1 helix-turn-helix domain-containing protein [Microbacterium stercoris]